MRCSRSEDIHTFFKEADFGYVAKRINSMEDICVPRGRRDGFLKCSEQLQFCQ